MSKFNFNIDINNNDSNLTKSTYKNQSQIESYKKYSYVDLDLPGHALWARYNVGVDINNLETYKDWWGGLYAWGELETKEVYDWNTYEHNLAKGEGNVLSRISVQKFNKLTELPISDDVAYFNNNDQRIPTQYELTALFNNTQVSKVHDYSGIKGLHGIVLTSLNKSNKDHLFFPATYFDNIQHKNDNDNKIYLWTRNKDRYSSVRAYGYVFSLTSINGNVTSYEMRHGFSIRGIKRN